MCNLFCLRGGIVQRYIFFIIIRSKHFFFILQDIELYSEYKPIVKKWKDKKPVALLSIIGGRNTHHMPNEKTKHQLKNGLRELIRTASKCTSYKTSFQIIIVCYKCSNSTTVTVEYNLINLKKYFDKHNDLNT